MLRDDFRHWLDTTGDGDAQHIDQRVFCPRDGSGRDAVAGCLDDKLGEGGKMVHDGNSESNRTRRSEFAAARTARVVSCAGEHEE